MTLLYGARYSFVLLRLKSKAKMLPQSAEKWENLAILFLKEKTADDRTFLLSSAGATTALGWEGLIRKSLQGAKKKINIISKFSFFCKNYYTSAVNTHFWSWSNFNISGKTNMCLRACKELWGFGACFGPPSSVFADINCKLDVHIYMLLTRV